MILLDANLLLYAHNEEAEQHENARDYLEKLLNSEKLVGIPWTSIWAFLRIATHRQIFRTPFTSEEACEIVSSWLECRKVMTPEEERKLLKEASIQIKEGRPELALPILASLSPTVQVKMKTGHALRRLKQFKEAADAFYDVLELRPDAEVASISRFLCLAFLGNFHLAVQEMECFLSENESEEYVNVCLDYPDQFKTYFGWANLDEFPCVKQKVEEAAMRGPGNFVETERPLFDYIDVRNHLSETSQQHKLSNSSSNEFKAKSSP